MPDGKVEAKRRAEHAFGKVTEKLKELKVPFAPVSTLKKTQKEYGGQLIRSVSSLCPLKSCYYRNDARGIDPSDAEQFAGCSRPFVGPLGHCSAN